MRRCAAMAFVAVFGALLIGAKTLLGTEVPEACTVPADGTSGKCVPPADPDVAPANATERILDYRSRILVGADGTLTVTETITVQSAGEQIKRGIYRDFPTEYPRTLTIGDVPLPILRVQVPFDVVDVQRDGHREPYHTEDHDNGVRVYIGNPDVELPPGRHTYAITYTTAHQLGFFADHDELYWNVTGNGWQFPIDHAVSSCRTRFRATA